LAALRVIDRAPVLELPAHDTIGSASGRRPVMIGRHELRGHPAWGVLDEHGLARTPPTRHGRHRGFAFEAIPGDAGDRVHARPHLVEHLARMRVVPVEANAAAELVQQPEIFFRFARRLNGLAAELHHAIRVRHGADLLRPRRRGQHDVGEVRGFGQENVLNDKMIE
jgi:hypothetical protein